MEAAREEHARRCRISTTQLNYSWTTKTQLIARRCGHLIHPIDLRLSHFRAMARGSYREALVQAAHEVLTLDQLEAVLNVFTRLHLTSKRVGFVTWCRPDGEEGKSDHGRVDFVEPEPAMVLAPALRSSGIASKLRPSTFTATASSHSKVQR